MLKKLSIKNYALITQLEMHPDEALNIVTGETGAGKSIMLGAIGLLLGNRADTKALFSSDKKCVIEGEFDLKGHHLSAFFEEESLDDEDPCLLRREISPSGKSRAFINDTPVTLEVLRKLGAFLMDIHSQHDNLLLGKHDFQLSLVDAYSQNQRLLTDYQSHYQKYRQASKTLQHLKESAAQLRKESDYNDFLLEELAKAKLQEEEQEKLEESLKVLEHAEEIKLHLNQALGSLQNTDFSAIHGLQQAEFHFQQLHKYTDKYQSLHERLESTLIELNDLIHEAEKEEEKIEYDPGQTEGMRQRLSMIYQLQKKHQVDNITGLLDIQRELEVKVQQASSLEEDLTAAEQALKKATESMNAKGKALHQSRVKVFPDITKKITTLLQELGMPDATIHIKSRPIAPAANGMDEVDLHFSANKGVAPQPLREAASGGEFSRLMFCIKYVLADKMSLPTMIFDEIDTGISGEIALKMGEMMKVMAKQHQVISISHLPQIAAKGDAHYFVYKDNSSDRTVSKVKVLTPEERIEAIAKMIGGDQPSDIAYENARELIGK